MQIQGNLKEGRFQTNESALSQRTRVSFGCEEFAKLPGLTASGFCALRGGRKYLFTMSFIIQYRRGIFKGNYS
ncbi:hypothetical protein [Caproicibacter sp. BJN0012]|uniref:hypothetical protein n=1 Tax=Caproicibacter sp. BJN0012 TaxID=3110227 RepID=UPI002E0F7A9B